MKTNNKKQSGFAMLEVMFAVVLLGLTILGAYYLYQSILTQQKNTRSINEITGISSIFDDLYNARLTDDISSESDLISALYNSQRLPNSYFSDDSSNLKIVSSYGTLSFTKVSSTSFTTKVPVSENTDGAKNQICDGVADQVTSCTPNADEATVTVVINAGD